MIVRYNFPGIYAIINKHTLQCYYGQSAKSIGKRWADELHLLRNNKHHSIHLQRSFNKHGEKCIGFIVIENYEDFPKEHLQHALNSHEQQLIEQNTPNYNCCSGGKSSFKLSEETLQKLRPQRKEMWQRPGFRESQIAHQLRVWKDSEYKEKMSNIQKQSWENPEIREKYITSSKKYWSDKENRKKKSEAIKKFWQSKEAKEKASQHSKRIWSCPIRTQEISKKRKELWANPEWRKNTIEKQKQGKKNRKAQPTEQEPT